MTPETIVIKLFMVVLYDFSKKPVKPSLIFMCKARAYLNEAPFRRSPIGWAPGLTHKHQTRLERPARDKHVSFYETFVNYD